MSQLPSSPLVSISPLVSNFSGVPATTSLKVAEIFGKKHLHVLRDIGNLKKDCPQKFTEPNFGLSEYRDSTGRKLPMYILPRDGFTLLVMGYTGKEAMKFKLAYIEAFNAMEEQLRRQQARARMVTRRNALADARKLPEIEHGKKWSTEKIVDEHLKKSLYHLEAAYKHGGLMCNLGHCPIQDFRKPLFVSAMSNINAAAAIVRAMITAEEFGMKN